MLPALPLVLTSGHQRMLPSINPVHGLRRPSVQPSMTWLARKVSNRQLKIMARWALTVLDHAADAQCYQGMLFPNGTGRHESQGLGAVDPRGLYLLPDPVLILYCNNTYTDIFDYSRDGELVSDAYPY